MCIEAGAGVSAHYPDAHYEEAGARLVDRAEALAADIVLKVRKPDPGRGGGHDRRGRLHRV